MSTRPSPPAVLTEEHTAFVCAPHSIFAASRNAAHVPSIARCQGCEVSADRRRVTVLFHSEQAATLLRDIGDTGTIAVVFNEPATNITLQLKGRDARLIPLPGHAEALADRHLADFAAVVEPLGHTAELVRAVFYTPPAPITAVQFTPDAAYQQTPGPKAGARLA